LLYTIIRIERKVRAPDSSVAGNSRPPRGEDHPTGVIFRRKTKNESHRDESVQLTLWVLGFTPQPNEVSGAG